MTVITLNGSPLHTMGALPEVGSKAPDFIVTKPDLSEISLKNCHGKKILLNIFPSLDTPTCANAMHQFNDIANRFQDTIFLCISADLPFAQKRFCKTEHLENVQPASVFRHAKFGEDYGVTIIDGPLAGLLSRAVVILDTQGNIIYTEQVKELSNEPNYSAMMNALRGEIKTKIES
jgi:thiol peroxidase